MCERVVSERADIGIALDGDADRLIVADEKGNVVDGDQLLALLAGAMKKAGALAHDTVVATVMSNLGLERHLAAQGMKLERTPVGDRNVVERMRAGSFNLGGEQSGHIVLSDYSTTGDGLLAALQVLALLKEQGGRASELTRLFAPLPQLLQNVRYESGLRPLENAQVQEAIGRAQQSLANDGRLLVRASGTEPLIRVMAEGENSDLIRAVVTDLCAVIESVR
jgi:phosphoglucosamine mutase